jgi:hypothetical protein
MIDILLSGGAFGGDTVAVSAGAEFYDGVDTLGTVWRYRVDGAARVGVLAEVVPAA